MQMLKKNSIFAYFQDQQKSASSDNMKTRSGQETQGKASPGSMETKLNQTKQNN